MNTTQLIENVRRKWMGPQTTLLATDDDNILSNADDVISDEVLPALYKLKEDFCTVKTEIPCVSGVNAYDIPKRAFNGLLRHVWIIPSQSTDGVELTRISESNKYRHTATGTPSHFWFENDQLVVNGTPEGTLVLSFPFQPGSLVGSDDYRIVSSVTPATNTITLTEAPPTAWIVTNEVLVIDAFRSGMPRYWDKAVSNIAGNDITFGTEIAGTTFGSKAIQAGDYVALAHNAGRPMVPEGLHSVIAQGVCELIAQGTEDTDLFQIAHGKFQQTLKEGIALLDVRAVQKMPIINWNSRFRRRIYPRLTRW